MFACLVHDWGTVAVIVVCMVAALIGGALIVLWVENDGTHRL